MSNRIAIYDKFGGRCAYCGIALSKDRRGWQVDHVHPKRLGGSDKLDNLFPSCAPCNNRKRSFTVDEFRQHLLECVEVERRNCSNFKTLERFGIVEQVKVELLFYFEKVNHKTITQIGVRYE